MGTRLEVNSSEGIGTRLGVNHASATLSTWPASHSSENFFTKQAQCYCLRCIVCARGQGNHSTDRVISEQYLRDIDSFKKSIYKKNVAAGDFTLSRSWVRPLSTGYLPVSWKVLFSTCACWSSWLQKSRCGKSLVDMINNAQWFIILQILFLKLTAGEACTRFWQQDLWLIDQRSSWHFCRFRPLFFSLWVVVVDLVPDGLWGPFRSWTLGSQHSNFLFWISKKYIWVQSVPRVQLQYGNAMRSARTVGVKVYPAVAFDFFFSGIDA